MGASLAPIRPILTIADICDLLRISTQQFYALKAQGLFDRLHLLQPLEPDIDATRRYLGEPFVEFLSSKRQRRLLADTLREIGRVS